MKSSRMRFILLLQRRDEIIFDEFEKGSRVQSRDRKLIEFSAVSEFHALAKAKFIRTIKMQLNQLRIDLRLAWRMSDRQIIIVSLHKSTEWL